MGKINKELTDKLANLLTSRFELEDFVNKGYEIEFKLNDETIKCGIHDETDNSYLLYDYNLWYWSCGCYEGKSQRLGRGKNIGLLNNDTMEDRIIEFFKREVLGENNFTKFWKNIERPVIIEEKDVAVKTCIEPDKKEEPMTLFDFM